MLKQYTIFVLIVVFFITACSSEAPAPPTVMAVESTSTIAPTPQPLDTDAPKPTPESDPLPSPTFPTNRIYIMGFGWADNNKEFTDEMINTSIQGAGLEKIEITLESNIDVSIMVTIVPGTLFTTVSPSVQTMVARELVEIILEPHIELNIELEVACANMHLDTPGPNDFFSAAWPPAIPNLSKLVISNSFIEHESFRVQQFAIWIITDNPSGGNFVHLGSIGTGSGPSESEINQIHQLFEEAGISTDGYNVLD